MKPEKSIKTKQRESSKAPSSRRIPDAVIRKLLLRSKQQTCSQLKQVSEPGQQSSSVHTGSASNAPVNYAEEQLAAAAETVTKQTTAHIYQAGKKLVKKIRKKTQDTRRLLRDAKNQEKSSPVSSSLSSPFEKPSPAYPKNQNFGYTERSSHQYSSVRHPDKFIKTKPGKSIKTLQREVRHGKQAMKTAETGAKAAKQGEKAAVQTAKQAPKAVKTAGQAMKQVPRAVKAVGQTAKAIAKAAKETAHAVVSAVKAGISAIKSGAAAFAAGGWAVVLAVVILCTIVLIVLAAMGIGQPPAWSGTGPMDWPLPGECSITSLFGTRADPFTGDISRHTGVDVAASEGTAILAAADGVVEFVNDTDLWGDSYGYYLRIRHDETYETLYAHCSGILVREGQEVKAGEPVALVGSTGNSTGSHLHFEVWVMGERWIPWTFLCRGSMRKTIQAMLSIYQIWIFKGRLPKSRRPDLQRCFDS